MSMINTFIQRRKMREYHHGIIMVAIAYLLSIFMLFIGSDVLYKTPRSAAGVNNMADESAEELDTDESVNAISNISIVQLAETLEKPIDKIEELYIQYPTVSNYMDYRVIVDITDIDVDKSTEIPEVESEDEISSFSATVDTTLAIEEEAEEKARAKYVVDISEEEITMLERIVQAEAGSEDLKGRVLVANVIINRTKDDDFPDNIEEVIFQNSGGEYQFSPVSDKRYWSVKITNKTKEAVRLALEGEDYSDGALFFMARKKARVSSARWFDNNLKWLFKHGGHEFFR